MEQQQLVLMKDTGHYPLLACGHYGACVHPASSTWDFPMDPLWCSVCKDLRCLDIELQSILMAERASIDAKLRAIYSVTLDYHAEIEPVYQDCHDHMVLYQDLTQEGDWAGTIRLVGHPEDLWRIIDVHWSGPELLYGAEVESFTEWLDLYGEKV